MGREARCVCRWGDRSGTVTVLLEGHELIVRGAIRMAIARTALQDVRVDGERLAFRSGDDAVTLDMGAAAATRWARAIAVPAPTLAQKLGVTAKSRVALVAAEDIPELTAALAGATIVDREATLVIACVEDARALDRTLTAFEGAIAARVPMWIVYRKGRGTPLGEQAIRTRMRERGLTDSKVTAVSPLWTALRFVRAPERAPEPARRRAPAARKR